MKLVTARILVAANAVGKEIFTFKFMGGGGRGEQKLPSLYCKYNLV